jgi:small subunit ribosomal protein S2
MTNSLKTKSFKNQKNSQNFSNKRFLPTSPLFKKGGDARGLGAGAPPPVVESLLKKGRQSFLRVGDICDLKITALAPNNIGIDEITFPYAVFIPNAKYGSSIKAKILKINKEGLTTSPYAIAQLVEEVKQAPSDLLKDIPVNPGDSLTVSITKQISYSKASKALKEKNPFYKSLIKTEGLDTGLNLNEFANCAGIVELTANFCLIIPCLPKHLMEEGLDGKGVGHSSSSSKRGEEQGEKKPGGEREASLPFVEQSSPNPLGKSVAQPTNAPPSGGLASPGGLGASPHKEQGSFPPSRLGVKGAQLPTPLPVGSFAPQTPSPFGVSQNPKLLSTFGQSESKKQNGNGKSPKIKVIVTRIKSKYGFAKLYIEKENLLERENSRIPLLITTPPPKVGGVGSKAPLTPSERLAALGGGEAKLPFPLNPLGKSAAQPANAPPKGPPEGGVAASCQGLRDLPPEGGPVEKRSFSSSLKASPGGLGASPHGATTNKCLVHDEISLSQEYKKWKGTYTYGSKFTTTLPLNSQKYGKYVVLKMKDSVLFVKLQKGVYLGDKVRIKITSSANNFLVGKILQVNPMNQSQKKALVINSIRDMINNGMHFGEKAVKCHARMKLYLWSKKQGLKKKEEEKDRNRPLIKKGRHIINLLKTRRCLNKALNTLTKYALKGRPFLFIGTKKPASGLVARASFFTKNSFYVNTRWLGGMLTNWKTICKSISKIRPILKEKQKVVRDILERRQAIKSRLIKKALLLKKKSQLILTKGRALIKLLKMTNPSTATVSRNEMTLRAQKLMILRDNFISKGMDYLQKRQKLIQKRRELIYQSLILKEKGFEISNKYQTVLSQLVAYTKKLREYKYLLILTSEIQKLLLGAGVQNCSGGVPLGSKAPLTLGEALRTATSEDINVKENRLYSVSYGKFKDIQKNHNYPWIIPNPPKEILNRIVLTIKNQYEDGPLGLGGQSPKEEDKRSFSTGTPAGGGSFLPSDSKLKISLVKKTQKLNQIIICSTLLAKFSRFSPYIKNVIKSLIQSMKSLEIQAIYYANELNKIKKNLISYLQLKKHFVTELQQLKTKLTNERHVIRIVKHQLKTLDAQKKLMKYLPRLRYLPTPQTKISQIVQILLSKIVDPKLKYPIETIYDQKLSTSSKKLSAARKKKWQRLEKYFGGIANMTKLTKTNISRNVAIIIGQKEEMNAVRECKKLGIKMFAVVDTNCNPTLADHIIPANDDSRNAIKYILTKIITRIRLAQKLRLRLQKRVISRG